MTTTATSLRLAPGGIIRPKTDALDEAATYRMALLASPSTTLDLFPTPRAIPMSTWRLITDLAPRLRPGRHVK